MSSTSTAFWGLNVPRFIPVGAARRRPLERGGRCYAARSLARWQQAWLALSIKFFAEGPCLNYNTDACFDTQTHRPSVAKRLWLP
jgi:hypothetical protein